MTSCEMASVGAKRVTNVMPMPERTKTTGRMAGSAPGCQNAHGDMRRGEGGKETDRNGKCLKRDGGACGEHVHRIQQDDGERRGDE